MTNKNHPHKKIKIIDFCLLFLWVVVRIIHPAQTTI